jgi:DNA-binding GntR family transcriptional regulator
VALAAERVSRAELNATRALLRRLQGLEEARREEFWALNHQLHFAIYAAAKSPLLLSIIESLWLQIGRLLTRIPVSRALKGSADPHDLLVQALERHDAVAARAPLGADLTSATEQMMKELASQEALRA